MRMEHLEYLIVLSQTLSITKAADELFTTHQNVSKMLRQLEQEMGTDLFERMPKGLKITKAGEIMLKFAKETLRNLKKAQTAISESQINHQLSGEIYLYCTGLTSTTVLLDVLEQFNKYYPNITLHIHEGDTYDILRQVNLHGNMLGIIPILNDAKFQAIYQPYLTNLQIFPLLEDRYIASVSSNSPLAKQKSVSLSQFLSYPLAFTQNNAFFPHILETFGKVQIGFTTNNHELYLHTIASGRCVGVSSRHNHHLKQDRILHQQIHFLPFEENLSFNVCLVSSFQINATKPCQAFIDFIKQNPPQFTKTKETLL